MEFNQTVEPIEWQATNETIICSHRCAIHARLSPRSAQRTGARRVQSCPRELSVGSLKPRRRSNDPVARCTLTGREEQNRTTLVGESAESMMRVCVCACAEDNHGETLWATIDAACYRNNGQTRRDNAMPRAYITLVPVFGQLHACARHERSRHCMLDATRVP